MALTTLDRTTALIVIDMQKGIVALPTVHPVERIIERTMILCAGFRRFNQPVVLVNVAGTPAGRRETGPAGKPSAGWAELIPELDRQAQDYTVTKHSWGAFTGTGLDAWLRRHGVTQIVLAGISTSIGVETTARQAFELGYNVVLATDAMTDTNLAAHQNSISLIFPRLGETGQADEILARLTDARE